MTETGKQKHQSRIEREPQIVDWSSNVLIWIRKWRGTSQKLERDGQPSYLGNKKGAAENNQVSDSFV